MFGQTLPCPRSLTIILCFAIENGFAPVVGTTGFTPEQIQELTDLSREKDLGGLIAPNFAIGAVLLMQFAAQAAKYFPNVEIIELHHDKKKMHRVEQQLRPLS